MKILRSDRSRAFRSWGFGIGVIGTMLVLTIGSLGFILAAFKQMASSDGLINGFHEQALLAGLSSDIMLFSAPILCALPFTAAFVDDFKSGYIKQLLPRIGKKPYMKSKIGTAVLSGGLVPFLGIMAVYLVFALVFTPMELAPQLQQTIGFKGALMISGPSAPSPFSAILGNAMLFFLFGGLFSLIGFLCASVSMSRYMAYASPFILYYVLIILCDRYMQQLYVLNPQQWLTPSGLWPGGVWGIALLLFELVLVVAVCCYVSMSGRLADG